MVKYKFKSIWMGGGQDEKEISDVGKELYLKGREVNPCKELYFKLTYVYGFLNAKIGG